MLKNPNGLRSQMLVHNFASSHTIAPVFFQKEFDQYSFDYRADGVASIQNKVGAFLADPLLNRILTNSKSEIHEGKSLLVNLAKATGRGQLFPFGWPLGYDGRSLSVQSS